MLVLRDDFTYKLYQYEPVLVPAIVAAVLFASGGIAHVLYLRKFQTPYFIPFMIGCFMEAAGYGGRIWSHYDRNSIPAFSIQEILILIAPALYAASIYMVLARIIALVDGERHALIPLGWLTKVFVIGDCISFLAQASGGGIQAGGTLQLLHLGEKIIIVGLFLQIFFFGFFIVTAVMFHMRIRKAPTTMSASSDVSWQQNLSVLYIASGIILVRSVFRIVEYMMGNSGWLLSHEYMHYIFDTILMFIVLVIFLLRHPGLLLRGVKKDPERESGTSFTILKSRN